MKDELNALAEAAVAILETSFADMLASTKRRHAEQEYRALTLLFFCHHGKFPDEV